MGIGNTLKSDDGVGHFIIKELNDINSNNLVLVDAATAPENFTGFIKSEKPSHIIIIDATLMDEKHGHIGIFNKEDFGNVNMSTHSMNLSVLIRYLEQNNLFKILFIGIQPESLDFSLELSDIVKKSSYELIDMLKSFFI